MEKINNLDEFNTWIFTSSDLVLRQGVYVREDIRRTFLLQMQNQVTSSDGKRYMVVWEDWGSQVWKAYSYIPPDHTM